MSLLTLVQSATRRLGLNVPAAVATSTDPAVLQIMELASEEGQEMAARTNWSFLTQQATFTTVATENQGLITTIAPALKFIINETIWNRTLRRPVFGPLSPQQWQQMEAMVMQGPWNQWRIVGQYLKFIPVPAAGQSCYFEYVSKNWGLANDGVTGKSAYSADSDTALLDENIMVLGLIWRWRAAKGLDFTADLAKYESKVLDAIGRDGSKPILSMGDVRYDIFPGVLVPAGSWN